MFFSRKFVTICVKTLNRIVIAPLSASPEVPDELPGQTLQALSILLMHATSMTAR